MLHPHLKRLLYRASHRGTKELDLMLGAYARAAAPGMDDAMRAHFEAFLDQPDPLIDDWLRGAPPPDEWAGFVADIRAGLGL